MHTSTNSDHGLYGGPSDQEGERPAHEPSTDELLEELSGCLCTWSTADGICESFHDADTCRGEGEEGGNGRELDWDVLLRSGV
eukprot:768356-Hanusia_phi.AAC.3